MNIHSRRNKGCIHKGESESGVVFAQILEYVKNSGPTIVVLENVPALLENSEEAGESEDVYAIDADYIVGELRKCGMWAYPCVLQALDYGSPAARNRLYIVALRFPATQTGHLATFQQFLGHTKIDSMMYGFASNFVCLDPDRRLRILQNLGLPSRGCRGVRPRQEEQWKHDYLEIFGAYGEQWPAVRPRSIE